MANKYMESPPYYQDDEDKYGIIDIEPSTPGQKLDIVRPDDYDTLQSDLRRPKKTNLKYQKVNESQILKEESFNVT